MEEEEVMTANEEMRLAGFKHGQTVKVTNLSNEFAFYYGVVGIVEGAKLNNLGRLVISIRLVDEDSKWIWVRPTDIEHYEEKPVAKEKTEITVDAPLANRVYSGEFLTRLGEFAQELATSVEYFNDTGVESKITKLQFTIKSGDNDESPLVVELMGTTVNGEYCYGVVLNEN